MIRIILFDLDETLYPRHTGVMSHFRAQVLRYIRERLHISHEEAEALQRHYFHTYGTTMRGLQIHHQVDPEEYMQVVHDIPLEGLLEPNPELDAVLGEIPHDKVVFTNASREHAERVLGLLGIRHHFTHIVDVRDVQYQSKPQSEAYHRICSILGVLPQECVIVEDNVRNLLPAKALGMTTVLVQDGLGERPEGVDYAIDRIEEIGKVVAQLGGRVRGRPTPEANEGRPVAADS